jgi:hypothetical protein
MTRAEGAKQAAILQAEGRREAAFRDSEARERQAEAEAKATALVSDAVAQGDVRALNYFVAQKYVEAFGQLAASPQQRTVIVPADFGSLAGAIAGVGDLLRPQEGAASPQPAHLRATDAETAGGLRDGRAHLLRAPRCGSGWAPGPSC